MHRSGTSAYARFASLLGAKLPSRLLEANFANETGFWEPQEGAELNDWFLGQIGSSWSDTSTIPETAFESDAAAMAVSRIEDFLAREFTGASTFVLKDPRNTRLAPLWIRGLRAFGAEPTFIIPIRNPLEVAASLVKRDGMARGQALLLWLRCTLDAERASRNFRRSFVRYDALLDDWKGVAARVAKDCGFTWPIRPAQAESQIDAFLDPNRRNQRADENGLADLPEWFQVAYRALLAATEGQPIDSEALDDLRAQIERADSAYAPYIWRLNETQTELTQSLHDSQQRLEALEGVASALEDREERLVRMQQAYDAMQEGLAAARQEIDAVALDRDGRLEAARSEIEAVKLERDALELRRDELQAQHAALTVRFDALHHHAAGLTQDLAGLDGVKDQRDALQVERDALLAEAETLSETFARHRAEVAEQEAARALEAERSRIAAEQRRQTAEAEQRTLALKQERERLLEHEALKQQLAALAGELHDAADTIGAARRAERLALARAEALEADLDRTRQALIARAAENALVEARAQALERDLMLAQEALQARMAQAAEAQAQAETLARDLQAQLNDQIGTLAALRGQNATLEKRVAQQGSDGVRLEAMLREAEADIRYTAGQLRQAQARIHEQEAVLAGLGRESHQLQLILRSRSWFLTKPLRFLTRLAGRVRRRLALAVK